MSEQSEATRPGTAQLPWDVQRPSGGALFTGGYGLSGPQCANHVVPYFDQAPLYNTMNTSVGFNSAPNFGAAALTILPGLLCPSNPVTEGVNWTGGSNPAGSDPNNDSARTHYVPAIADTGTGRNASVSLVMDNGNGLIYHDSKTRFGDVTDGTSNTLAFL